MVTPKEEAKRKKILTAAYEDHKQGLSLYSFFKVRDSALGEDLVQETFTKTWSYLVKGGKVDLMRAFLYHVLNGLIVDEYRKHKPVSLDVLLEKGYEPPAPPSAGQLHNVFNILDGKAALILIGQLPLKYQQVMRMKYVQDLTLTEMALLTGQTKNTLAVQVHRGLEKLKLLYDPEQPRLS